MADDKKDRRLTTSLPVDVWDRLDAEARAQGITVATLLRRLVIARDKRENR
jgi:hypothetical protein